MSASYFNNRSQANKHNFYLDSKKKNRKTDVGADTKKYALIIGVVIMVLFIIYAATPLSDIWEGKGESTEEETGETTGLMDPALADEVAMTILTGGKIG